jgi:hypothetical protein
MRLDGLGAERKGVGNFLGPISLDRQPQHFFLTRRQACHFPAPAPDLLELLHQQPGNLARHRRPAPVHLLDRRQNLRRRQILDQVSARPGL